MGGKIGANTAVVVEALFSRYKVEQQGYRTCMSLLKLSEQYTPERLEAACGAALRYTPRPSYKAIQTILRSGRDKLPDETQASAKHPNTASLAAPITTKEGAADA